jgi:tellurium resistance protein TerD
MAISLTKGGNISLSNAAPNLKNILIGLGWNPRSTSGDQFDLDASAFLVGETGKVSSDRDLVIGFGKDLETNESLMLSRCGSVEHTGDNRDGGGDGDDEEIKINLEKVPDYVKKIIICVTIDNAVLRRQNFGQVDGAYMRIVNSENDVEIARFDLSEDYSTETAMIFGEVYRHNGDWKFKAVGQGFSGGLEAMCKQFGVDVA